MHSLSIEDYWEGATELGLKRQALTGALLAIDEKQSAINHELSASRLKREQFRHEVDKFSQDWRSYMTSGLFGGEPKLFTGGKDILLIRKQVLENKQSLLMRESQLSRERQRELNGVRDRTKADCVNFIESVGEAIRITISSVIRESQCAVQEQGSAAAELAGLKWLVGYANKSRKEGLWSALSQLDVAFLSDAPDRETHWGIEQFIKTLESISKRGFTRNCAMLCGSQPDF